MLKHSTQKPSVKLKCLVLGAAAAGKTSLIRRYVLFVFRRRKCCAGWCPSSSCLTVVLINFLTSYFYNKFDSGSRVPTVGSDWYTASVKSPLDEEECEDFDGNVTIGVQMWDTPGRERFDAKRQRQQGRSISDSFLLQADAIMLVYDMTSSTSFKQLLKWYRDLVLLEWCPPLLVCANKLDLFLKQQRQQERVTTCTVNNPQYPMPSHRRDPRDVLGLHGHYRGNDTRYEYHVSVETPPSSRDSRKSETNHRHMEAIPSYLADRENWTSDGSYLESLLTTEDQSNPDIEMVKLWCLRHSLQHVESSAASGEGVEDAFRALMRLALISKRETSATVRPMRPMQDETQSTQQPPNFALKRNDALDFHKRYAPNKEPCCFALLKPVMILLNQERA